MVELSLRTVRHTTFFKQSASEVLLITYAGLLVGRMSVHVGE